MKLKQNISASLVDTIGGTLFVACAVAFVWLSLFHNDATNDRIDDLKQWIVSGEKDAEVLTAAQKDLEATLASRQQELSSTGQVPVEAPIEAYFQELSVIASRLDLQVMRQHPLGSRWYPGLQEQRWSYDVKGTTASLMRFLKAIEGLEYWADVSYLKIEGGFGSRNATADKRIAYLTISFFSAPPAAALTQGKDT